MPKHVFKPNIPHSSHRKQGNAHCILVASYIFPLSLSIPSETVALQVLYFAIPMHISCTPLYAADAEPSISCLPLASHCPLMQNPSFLPYFLGVYKLRVCILLVSLSVPNAKYQSSAGAKVY